MAPRGGSRTTTGARRTCVTGAALALAACLTLPPAARATVGGGVSWLVGTQEASGLWGTSGGTPFRDAAAAVTALATLNVAGDRMELGLQGLNATVTSSTDYLARCTIANAIAHPTVDHSARAAALVARRGSDNAWGYGPRYAGNVLETALALEALRRTGYVNLGVLAGGTGFINARQNADGGWGFAGGDTSRVFYTAHVVLAYQVLKNDLSLATQINNAVAWLKTKDRPDGGFGSGAASTAYETALAVLAIAGTDSLAAEVTNGRNWLTAHQLPDGSWDDDPYNTALALRALRNAPLVGADPGGPGAHVAFAVNPNPASGSAVVSFSLPRAGHVELAVFDVAGRLVRTLARGPLAAGEHTIAWDARSDGGGWAPSGTYFVRLRSQGATLTRRLALAR